jgi:hypothetical protein
MLPLQLAEQCGLGMFLVCYKVVVEEPARIVQLQHAAAFKWWASCTVCPVHAPNQLSGALEHAVGVCQPASNWLALCCKIVAVRWDSFACLFSLRLLHCVVVVVLVV